MGQFTISEWITPEILLTMYASIISTIALIWNIVIAILEKCSRLKVSVEFRDSISAGIDGKIIKGPTVCFIRIVNKGNHKKYISSIDLCLPYKTSNGTMFALLNQGIQFPVEILPQQEYVYKFKFRTCPEMMLENYKEGKCRIIVVDTIHKKYKSHKFNVSRIKRTFEYNNSLSPLVLAKFEEKDPIKPA